MAPNPLTNSIFIPALALVLAAAVADVVLLVAVEEVLPLVEVAVAVLVVLACALVVLFEKVPVGTAILAVPTAVPTIVDALGVAAVRVERAARKRADANEVFILTF